MTSHELIQQHNDLEAIWMKLRELSSTGFSSEISQDLTEAAGAVARAQMKLERAIGRAVVEEQV